MNHRDTEAQRTPKNVAFLGVAVSRWFILSERSKGIYPMLPNEVKAPADALRKALSRNGWSVVETEQPFDKEWWAAEFWFIESDWSPQGIRVCLTFLLGDFGGDGLEAWAVCASKDRPVERPLNDNPLMRLKNVWQQELPSFVKELAEFRRESTEEGE
jgi:hypothetical protein